jgi:hypothetical protein
LVREEETHVYPLERAHEALDLLRSGHVHGKLALSTS